MSPLPPRVVHFVGRLWGLAHTFSPGSSLAAHRFACLGNPCGTPPWPCPLTVLENWFEAKAGVQPYQGGFLLHYLDKLVYPDVSASALTVAGVLVCVLNLAVYGRRMWIGRRR